jgi:hypothetical protein
MSLPNRFGSFFHNLTRRRRVEQDLADEINSYVDLSTTNKIKEGLSESEARRAALANTFIAVPLCLITIALLASYLPARRATRGRSDQLFEIRITAGLSCSPYRRNIDA